MNNETQIDFNQVFNYIQNNPNIIELNEYNKSFTSKLFYSTGKTTKKILHFVKRPETKAAVLLANWAATATLLLLMILSAARIATIALATFLLIIETYAVFGNVEYTLAYASARNYFKVAQ